MPGESRGNQPTLLQRHLHCAAVWRRHRKTVEQLQSMPCLPLENRSRRVAQKNIQTNHEPRDRVTQAQKSDLRISRIEPIWNLEGGPAKSTSLASAFPDSVPIKRTHPLARKNGIHFFSRFLAALFSSGESQDPGLGKRTAPGRENTAVFGADKSSLRAPSTRNSKVAGWFPWTYRNAESQMIRLPRG